MYFAKIQRPICPLFLFTLKIIFIFFFAVYLVIFYNTLMCSICIFILYFFFFIFLVDWLNLNHSFRHHSNSIFQCLPFITKPNSYYFSFIAELMSQSSDFSSWNIIRLYCQRLLIKESIYLPDGCVFLSKWAFNSSKACGVNDVRRFRFFDGSTPMKSVRWFCPLLYRFQWLEIFNQINLC